MQLLLAMLLCVLFFVASLSAEESKQSLVQLGERSGLPAGWRNVATAPGVFFFPSFSFTFFFHTAAFSHSFFLRCLLDFVSQVENKRITFIVALKQKNVKVLEELYNDRTDPGMLLIHPYRVIVLYWSRAFHSFALMRSFIYLVI
jgi:hypothetical protein